MSRVSGQGAATIAESGIHNRFFWSRSDRYCCSKPAHVSFTPNTLRSHGRKASQRLDHHNYYKKQRSGCKEQAKRMPKRRYFTTYPPAVFKSVKSLSNKKSIRECFIAPGQLQASIFLLLKYTTKKGKLSQWTFKNWRVYLKEGNTTLISQTPHSVFPSFW